MIDSEDPSPSELTQRRFRMTVGFMQMNVLALVGQNLSHIQSFNHSVIQSLALFANCPQAASMSLPRLRRTFTMSFLFSKWRANRSIRLTVEP